MPAAGHGREVLCQLVPARPRKAGPAYLFQGLDGGPNVSIGIG